MTVAELPTPSGGGAGVTCAALPEPRRTAAVAAVLSAMTLVVMDAGAMNLAAPSIGLAFDVPPDQALLVVTAYQATLVMALLPCGALGDRFGQRRVFASGIALFAAAAGLCAVAPSLPWLVLARGAQGLGGAAVMALGIALLRASVPRTQVGAAIGWNALTVALASAAAPSAAALVLGQADWRWLFVADLPVAALALHAARSLPRVPAAEARLDVASLTVSAGVFGLFVLAAQTAPRAPPAALACALAGAAALAWLVRREAPKPAPLIPLDLLANHGFRSAALAAFCNFFGQTAGLLAMTFHLQQDLRQTPLEAGMAMTAWPLATAAAAIVAGRAADRIASAWLCAAGGGLLATGLAAAAALPAGPTAVGAMALCGVGFGLFQTPNNRTLYLAAPTHRTGAAGGMQGTARLAGQTAGALSLTALFSLWPGGEAARAGLLLAAVPALAGAAISLTRGRRPR